MVIRLQLPNLSDLLPQGSIYALEGRGTSSVKTENDIYGNQVAVIPEVKTANQLWTIGAGYLPVAVTANCIAAYEQHTQLTLTDEAGTTFVVVISEYPIIERFKMPDGDVTYTIKLTLGLAPTAWGIPVLSYAGPRQFGR